MAPQRISFRLKVTLSQLLLFVLFVLVLFPLVHEGVVFIMKGSLKEEADELITLLEGAKSEQEMVVLLERQDLTLFFVLGLVGPDGHFLYDSYLSPRGLVTVKEEAKALPDVEEAELEGTGYAIIYSPLLAHKILYFSQQFQFHNKQYVLRIGFPQERIEELTTSFQWGFFVIGSLLLFLFSGFAWWIFSTLSSPIHQIINAIRPYQKGEEERMPDIALQGRFADDEEFGRLATTLNAMASRVRDQVESLKTERNEREVILDSLGEGVVAVDAQMQIRYLNPTATKFLGLPRRSAVGRPFPDPLGTLCAVAAELLRLCLSSRELRHRSLLDFGERKLCLDLIALPAAAGQGAILVVQDRSSERRVIEMGKDFVANASHELRTPITIIRGFAETLQDLPQITPQMLHEIAEKMVRGCHRMDHLVRSLLTLADLENLPESKLQECDLSSIVEECREQLLFVHPHVQVEVIKEEEELLVRADSDILGMALSNLLENAVKYSPPPAQIQVRLGLEEGWVQIEVRDRGIGIPAADLGRIFHRFYTVDKAHSRRMGGAGLGLSIVKTVIDKHHGKISVTSTLGQGTCFKIQLPSSK